MYKIKIKYQDGRKETKKHSNYKDAMISFSELKMYSVDIVEFDSMTYYGKGRKKC